jgi:hypothetical protein
MYKNKNLRLSKLINRQIFKTSNVVFNKSSSYEG